jgi:hypothetical protein
MEAQALGKKKILPHTIYKNLLSRSTVRIYMEQLHNPEISGLKIISLPVRTLCSSGLNKGGIESSPNLISPPPLQVYGGSRPFHTLQGGREILGVVC